MNKKEGEGDDWIVYRPNENYTPPGNVVQFKGMTFDLDVSRSKPKLMDSTHPSKFIDFLKNMEAEGLFEDN